ncbi:hypothetical protein CF319_g6052 [Tilletia indica]|nr:hypothetical protein CF319_g6052 [Tilletia indica]
MAPLTRQEQRLSMRGNAPFSTDIALQQILDEFDNYKKMMSAQNRDIIKTNIFGQGRIRHLEDQVTALEEKITVQTAGKTRAEARALQLEHQLSCIHVAFDYLAKSVTGKSSDIKTISAEEHLRRGGTSPPQMPPPPTHAKSNPVKIDPSALPAGVVRPVARPPALALGRVQEEHTVSVSIPTSPERKGQPQYMYGSVGSEINDHSHLLYPPLPSPTCTDNSSAPSPVRTPDLDFPITLPLRMQSASSASALAGLNIRIEPVDFEDVDLFQVNNRANPRPNFVRSDSSSRSVNNSAQPSSNTAQEEGTQSGSIRVTVRKRMQGRTSALISVPTSSTPRPSVVGPSSPWSTTEGEKGEAASTAELTEQAIRIALSDTSNTPTIRGPSSSSQKSKIDKEQRASISKLVRSRSDGTGDSYNHVDTPVLRPSFDLPSPEEQTSSADRFATVPSMRKRKMAPEGTRPLQIRSRSRSEDSCVCGTTSRVCKTAGTRQHAVNCDCSPCACGADPGTPGSGTPTEPGSATPRGQNVPLPPHQSSRSSHAAESSQASTSASMDRNAEDHQEEEGSDRAEENDDDSASGRPSRRARKEVNYALPKLNTKMRKPESESASSAKNGVGGSRLSGSSLSASRRSSANSALRAVAMVAAAQGKRTPKSSEEHSKVVAQLIPLDRSSGRSRSRSSSSDVSIMSFTSNSSGPALVRSPVMPEYVDEGIVGKSSSLSTGGVGSSMSRQDSRDTVVGGASDVLQQDGENDRSAGSTTIIPTEGSSSPSESTTATVEGEDGSQGASSRPTRRSSAAVKYLLPKLNTKMRKPDAQGQVGVVRKSGSAGAKTVPKAVHAGAKAEVGVQKMGRLPQNGLKPKDRASNQEEGHDEGEENEDDDEEDDDDDDDYNDDVVVSDRHDSASVSANIARYSTRTIRKSVIPTNYVLPKLNTKMRKPDPVAVRPSSGAGSTARTSTLTGTGTVMESPKRKSARRSMSTGNLLEDAEKAAATSPSLPSRSTSTGNIALNNVNRAGTKSLGRAAAAAAAAASGSMLPSESVAAARTSLHAMLTHTARERSGSSTSSASTVRGAAGVGRGSWGDDDEDEDGDEDEGEEEEEDEEEEGESDDSYESSSSPEEREKKVVEEEYEDDTEDDEVGEEEGDGTVDAYDDRMDPFFMSDPLEGQVERDAGGMEAGNDADSTADASAFAVGSASMDSNMSGSGSGYDESTVVLG